jgi:hypothetical protein
LTLTSITATVRLSGYLARRKMGKEEVLWRTGAPP